MTDIVPGTLEVFQGVSGVSGPETHTLKLGAAIIFETDSAQDCAVVLARVLDALRRDREVVVVGHAPVSHRCPHGCEHRRYCPECTPFPGDE